MAALSDDDAAAFGRAVTARRAELGLTRKEVAARAGLSYSYVSNIESGHKQPSAKALHALAAAIELRPAELHERADTLVQLSQSSPSWFRGDLALAVASMAAPPDDDDMRMLVRDVVREELSREHAESPSEVAEMRPIIAAMSLEALPSMAPPPPEHTPSLPPAIRAALPRWLTEPADAAVEIAIQSVVVERLHHLPADAEPEATQRTITEALDHLIEQARRFRKQPAPKPR